VTTAIATEKKPVGAKKKRVRKWRMWRDALLLVAPFTMLYLLFFLYPTARVFQLSFTNAPLIGEYQYVGFANFERLLNDSLFIRSVRNTLYFVALSVVPNTLVGLILALMVVRLKRLRAPILAAFFLPFMLPVSVVTEIWLWLLDNRYGVLQYVLEYVNNGRPLAVFRNPQWAMPMVALVTVWWTVGFNMLLFIAGLQGISKEYYEAAALDGANTFQSFRHITWPLLWPITALVLTLQLIAQLKIFDQVYLLTGGGPFNSTIVMLQYVYREAFQQFRGGYASTVSVTLFALIFVLSIVQVRILRGNRSRR
jgi:multiple sugar transport system permease protein